MTAPVIPNGSSNQVQNTLGTVQALTVMETSLTKKLLCGLVGGSIGMGATFAAENFKGEEISPVFKIVAGGAGFFAGVQIAKAIGSSVTTTSGDNNAKGASGTSSSESGQLQVDVGAGNDAGGQKNISPGNNLAASTVVAKQGEDENAKGASGTSPSESGQPQVDVGAGNDAGGQNESILGSGQAAGVNT